jgi:hypothetical protein
VKPSDRFAWWLMWTFRGQVFWWLVERLAFCLGVLVMMWLTYTVESRLMPVITDWSLDSITRQGNHYTMSGVMRKARACELIHTSVMAVPKVPLAPRVLVYQVGPNEILGAGGPVGRFTWGPWTVRVPDKLMGQLDWIDSIEVVGHHRCHALWTQETTYGRVPVERLPK